MKKITFINIINSLEGFVKQTKKFGEAIAKAYIGAGLERDFAPTTSYEYPYGSFMDNIVTSLAVEFADDDYPYQNAEDFINWWIWECDFGKEKHYAVVNGESISKPMAEVTLSNGKTYLITTPGKLYDVILKDKKLPRKEVIHPTINSGSLGNVFEA